MSVATSGVKSRVYQALRTARNWLFLHVLDPLLMFPVRRTPATLIVRLDAIGDFFIWLQSGAVEVTRFASGGGRRTVLVANSRWAAYAMRLRLWDEVIDLDAERFVRNVFYRIRMMVRIRAAGAELLIQPRAARILLQDDSIARLSGARRRIGSLGVIANNTREGQQAGNEFYDELVTVTTAHDVHETIRNAEFTFKLTGHRASICPLPESSVSPKGRRVVVAPGAGWPGRVWPVERFAALIQGLNEQYGPLEVIILGAPSDRAYAALLEQRLAVNVVNEVGTTSLCEFVERIASAELVICNDSSAFHIAMALGRKVVCFLGGGHYGWFGPYPGQAPNAAMARVLSVPMDCYWCNWVCRYERAPEEAARCVKAISLESAMAAAVSLMSAPTMAERMPEHLGHA